MSEKSHSILRYNIRKANICGSLKLPRLCLWGVFFERRLSDHGIYETHNKTVIGVFICQKKIDNCFQIFNEDDYGQL